MIFGQIRVIYDIFAFSLPKTHIKDLIDIQILMYLINFIHIPYVKFFFFFFFFFFAAVSYGYQILSQL